MGFYFNTDSITPSKGSGGGAVIESLSVTPSTSAQTITAPSGTDGYSPVSVAAVTAAIDANIIAENIKKDVTILSVTGTYEGSGGGGGGSDVPLTRIIDDNNNEIGTWFMNFTDSNGNVFKVICLDAQYRTTPTIWCSNTSSLVTNMPIYHEGYSGWWYDDAKETATENTQLILDYCAANNRTSTACSHCRSLSFSIGGVTYYGQLPNMREVFEMWHHRVGIESMDTSASTSTSTNFSTNRLIWASTQYNTGSGWYLTDTGLVYDMSKNTNAFAACHVLEIPLT